MTVVPRRPKRNALPAAGAVACSAAVAFGITSPQAADPQLDPADDSLESAAALLAAANTGGTVSTKAQRTFDRAITAIADIRNAREEIVEAQEAVDDP